MRFGPSADCVAGRSTGCFRGNVSSPCGTRRLGRAVHDGGWVLTGTATNPCFERPDHQPVDPRPPILSGSRAELAHHHELHGRDIVLGGTGGHWTGEHIDWDCFFAAFAN